VLDAPCGQGRHAHLLAEAGYRVDGIDYSPVLLALAATRGTGPSLHYRRADMRKLPSRWTDRFDGVVNLFTSRFLSRDWWETRDGTMVAQERTFDPLSGVLSIHSTFRRKSGRTVRREHRIRVYTATRLAELCAREGLIVEEGFDGFTSRPLTRRSGEMLLVARKQ